MARKTRKWADVERELFTPAQISEAAENAKREVLEMNLRELREISGKTQEELATAARIGQSELSRAERRDDHLLSTVRRYVEGLGGELEVVARFGDRAVKLRGV